MTHDYCGLVVGICKYRIVSFFSCQHFFLMISMLILGLITDLVSLFLLIYKIGSPIFKSTSFGLSIRFLAYLK
jgi:hypothetical protein